MLDENDENRQSVRKPKRNHLISRKKFRDFESTHPGAARDSEIFLRWCKVVEHALWAEFSDVKATFGHASHVGKFVVFNVGGGKYRVVAEIDYRFAKVRLRYVLTHPEYDKGDWRTAP